jgi:hypothetical protein
MNLFSQKRLRPEVRRRLMAKGRGHFIFYKGVLSWGGPVFVTITLWDWHGKYGWHIPRRQDLLSVSLYVTLSLAKLSPV